MIDQLKTLMVGLDLTEMDENLIRYAAFLSEQPSIEKVIFMHTEKNLDFPSELAEGFRRSSQPVEDTVSDMIESKVKTYFDNLQHVQVEVKVIEGSPVKELLDWSKKQKVDLIIVGRKLRLRGSGVLPQKILRSGRVSVLFVTEDAVPVLDHILISIDFSDYSMMALNLMLHSALNRPEIKITCLHVYEVPSGYITMGESYKDFDDRMQGFARNKYEQVLQDFPQLITRARLKLVRKENEDDIGELIVMEARKEQADLLVIGAKGKSAAALFIMGSVTEKILRYNDKMPLMVFKKKNESIGFLDALLNTDE